MLLDEGGFALARLADRSDLGACALEFLISHYRCAFKGQIAVDLDP